MRSSPRGAATAARAPEGILAERPQKIPAVNSSGAAEPRAAERTGVPPREEPCLVLEAQAARLVPEVQAALLLVARAGAPELVEAAPNRRRASQMAKLETPW